MGIGLVQGYPENPEHGSQGAKKFRPTARFLFRIRVTDVMQISLLKSDEILTFRVEFYINSRCRTENAGILNERRKYEITHPHYSIVKIIKRVSVLRKRTYFYGHCIAYFTKVMCAIQCVYIHSENMRNNLVISLRLSCITCSKYSDTTDKH